MGIQAKDIRNVVFAGHASKGKTTLCEALLNVAGTTERMGKTADANTVLDFDSEEKKRKISAVPINSGWFMDGVVAEISRLLKTDCGCDRSVQAWENGKRDCGA